MQPELTVLFGPDAGRCLVVDGELTIGRSTACDFTLVDSQISARHLTVGFDAKGPYIQDHGSRGGTFLNGRRVSRARLAHQDEITFGGTTMQVSCKAHRQDPSRITVDLTESCSFSSIADELMLSKPVSTESGGISLGSGYDPCQDRGRSEQMGMLLRMVQRISTQTSPVAVYESLISAIEILIPFQDVVVLRHDAKTEHQFVAVQHRWADGLDNGSADAPRKIRVNRALIELCHKDGEGLVQQLPGGDLVLVTPIRAQHDVLGVTYLRAKELLDPEVSLDLLATLSRQAGLILERCELLIEAQRERGRTKLAHQVLEHEEAKLRTVLDGLAEGVILARASGEMILANRRGAADLDVLCRRHDDGRLSHIGATQFNRWIEPIRDGETMISDELTVDGDPARHFQLSMTSVPLGKHGKQVGESGFCLAFRDDTDQYLSREQLIQAEKLSSLGEMISGIAHELNNPLFSILGYAELLHRSPEVGGGAREDLSRLARQAERCNKIVGNLLTFGRKHTPERALVQIDTLIHNVVELMAYKTKVRDIELQVLPGDLPPTFADGPQLEQVFLNLVNNAYQAISQADRPGVITIRTQLVDDRIEVRILDDGPGISAEHQKRLFDPFFTTKEVGHGTGLGLSVSYGIVREHHGEISVDSELGEGACFLVQLPVTEKPSPDPVETRQETSETSMPAMSILVVDDEEEILEIIQRALTALGHECRVTPSPLEALSLARREQFDCLLCDMQMPEMNGRALLQQLRADGLGLADSAVVMTGDLLSAETEAFTAQFGCQMLGKPFRLSSLPQVLRAATSTLRDAVPAGMPD